MTAVTRFAPSPTGRLHVGNLRTALHNWLWARQQGGRFLLRLDDTDAARSTDAFADAIRADLDWLGLARDGEVRQSARANLYEAAFARLREGGRVYPCYETAEELELRRRVLLGRGLPPLYERPPADAPVPPGRAPHWRFRLDDAPIAWDDRIRGPQHFDPAKLSDPVVRREDGSWLYLLPSVIDDIDMGVTLVVRGEDHVTNTATQLQMFAALGAPPPAFAHEALLVGTEGKLSKRLGSNDADHLRALGVEPLAVAALLARLGTADPVEPVASLQPLIDGLDFARFGRAPARFDEDELRQVNARTLHILPFAAVADRLPAGLDEAGWTVLRANLHTLADIGPLWAMVVGPVAPRADAADLPLLAAACEVAATIDWGGDPWRALTGGVQAATGAKGRGLFLPLRRAFTGADQGPDMHALLPLIGRNRALARLAAAAGRDAA